jgi:type II secretory ATPase GspE/PulE/Tfp pilus assembly ATPase PilB-like protein
MSAGQRAVIEKYGGVLSQIYAARGCEKCSGTGYFGRTVVAEILAVTEPLRQQIIEKRPMNASVLGTMKTIGHQAVAKYLQGITSFDEVMKILRE